MTNPFHINQQFRTNDLSHIQGGGNITVIFKSGFSKLYDKVKYPKAYTNKIISGKDKHSIKEIIYTHNGYTKILFSS